MRRDRTRAMAPARPVALSTARSVLTRRVSASCYGVQSRGGTFPHGVEAAGVGEFVSGSGWSGQVHAAARADGGELVVVTDQQLRPHVVHIPGDGGQGRVCVRGRTSRSCARATRTSSGWSRARRTSHGVRGLTRRDHARQALHKRPDRLVVGGEVHGAEVCDLAQVLRRRCCWRAVAGVVDRPDLGIGGWGGPRAVVPCSGTGPAGLACE
jgi:hypothetical protein